LPVAVVVPMVIGGFVLNRMALGAAPADALWLLAMTTILFAGTLVFVTADWLRRSDEERKQADRLVRESEERLRLMTEAIDEVFWMSERPGAPLYMSPAFRRLFGMQSDVLLRDFDAFLQIVYPDDREEVRKSRATQRRREPFDHEYRIIRHGEVRWIWSRGYPVAESTKYVGVVTDVTKRKEAEAALRESEERFRQVVENIEEVFWITDARDGHVLYVSARASAIWGRDAETFLTTRNVWADSLHPEDRARVLAAARKLQGGGYDEVYRIVRPDGTIRWIHDRAFPILDAHGKVHRTVGVAEDVTERIRTDERRARNQKLEALGTLAGGIAHDFNNILTAITGNAKIALDDLPPAHPAAVSLHEISKAGRRANELVKRILAFSRPDEVKRQSLDLAQALVDALGLVRATLPASIDIHTRFDSATPRVEADIAQIHQVFVNLMTNAGHAIGARRGVIDVTLEPATVDDNVHELDAPLEPGRYAVLTVTDNGCGMSAETRARIFDPFFTTKPVDVGTGLGLSVVHGIVQSHHGAIVVHSEPGRGSSFRIYLPAARAVTTPAVAPAPPKRSGSVSRRILYVDDEEPLVFLTERLLTRMGHRVVGFTSAREALARFREAPGAFDVVVTDLAMPGMTGFEFAEAVLALRADTPIVMTTGYTHESDREHAQRIGIHALILKPDTVDDLCDVINDIALRS